MTEIRIALRDGCEVTGLEVRPVGCSGRFALSRFDALTRTGKSEWMITHVPTGMGMGSAIPLGSPRTIAALTAIVRRWERLSGVDWGLIDTLPFRGQIPKSAAAKRLGQRLRDAAEEPA